jgi:NADPH:quinone reductase-like Zn-dependent oxidoreductase
VVYGDGLIDRLRDHKPTAVLDLADLYAQGRLSFHIRRTYTLEQAADAHREIETGHGRGKLVLTME